MEEVVLKYSPNVLKDKKASFILHQPDEEDLTTFRNGNGNVVKNTLIIRDRKPRLRKNEYFITTGGWKEKESEYEEHTRGCFVVLDYILDSEPEFYHRMEKYNKYYPVVFVSYYHVRDNDEKKGYLSGDMEGWNKRTSRNHGVTMYVNKSLSLFKEFTVSFKKILAGDDDPSNAKALVSTEIIVNSKGDELVEKIFPSTEEKKKPKPVSIRKAGKRKEADWSLFDGLPQPSMGPDHTSEVWIREFYLYLKSLMAKIVPKGKEKLIDILVNKETIQDYWLDIFTSEYHNPNTGDNYETYEAVGDSVIKYIFYIYLYEKFGTTISKNQLNDLKADHLSTKWQRILGEKMGLDQWILIPKELAKNAKIREDLTEAFAGGVEIILNKYTRRGLSEMVLLNMTHLLFRDYDFDLGEKMEKKKTPLVTKLIQWYGEIGGSGEKMIKERITLQKPRSVSQKEWDMVKGDFEKILHKKGILIPITEHSGNKELGVIYKTEENDNGTYTYSVYLNDAGYKALERKGLPVHKLPNNKFLAKATGREINLVSKNAKTRAMEKLEEIGLTDEWKAKRGIEKNVASVDGITESLVKARSEDKNIVKVMPKEVKRGTEHVIYQLHGIMKDGRKTILETVVFNVGNKINGYQEVIKKYLGEEE